MAGRFWEPWEENILKTKYKTETTRQIRTRYLPDRTEAAIRHKLDELDLAIPTNIRKGTPWTDTEIETLKAYYGKMTAKRLHDEHLRNRTVCGIRTQAGKLGLIAYKRNNNRKAKPCAHTSWSSEETDILINNARTTTTDKLADMLPGKTKRQIRNKICVLGLSKTERACFSEEEIRILKENASNCTIRQLLQLLPTRHDHRVVRTKLKELGLQALPGKAKDTPWTEAELNILRANMDIKPSALTKLLPRRSARIISDMKWQLRKKQRQEASEQQ